MMSMKKPSPLLDLAALRKNVGDTENTVSDYMQKIDVVKYKAQHAHQMKPFKPKVQIQEDLWHQKEAEKIHLQNNISSSKPSLSCRLLDSHVMKKTRQRVVSRFLRCVLRAQP